MVREEAEPGVEREGTEPEVEVVDTDPDPDPEVDAEVEESAPLVVEDEETVDTVLELDPVGNNVLAVGAPET